MKNPLARFRWYLLSLVAVIAVFFAWSRPHTVYYLRLEPATNGGWVIACEGGRVAVVAASPGPPMSGLGNGLSVMYQTSFSLKWTPEWQSGRSAGPIVPLWMLAAPLFFLGMLGFIPSSRRCASDCPRCGYDLRGVPLAQRSMTSDPPSPVTCPECGNTHILNNSGPVNIAQ